MAMIEEYLTQPQDMTPLPSSQTASSSPPSFSTLKKSRSFPRDRNIELILIKKEEGPYWPHLLKQKVKQHWLKVDFSRWKDEDDSEDEGEGQNQDLEEMMRQMGGLGGGGGGGDSRPSLDDLEDEDSDDDDLPDLE
ncbi:Protein wos2 [Chionoecetes opilio]|uniref:Protein wos2 n=1 Tax=Chionoecetes opilio TaxID=41210 RepID=A0A8J4Y773_CHIOP|nr:Protein wos2 [Chionoecetes opilio]